MSPRVGLDLAPCLLPAIDAFRRAYPHISVTVQRMLASRIPDELNLRSFEMGMTSFRPDPEAFRTIGSIEFSTLLVENAGVAVSPGIGFGEHGEGYVRIAMVENEQRIRQAARGVRRFLESGLETLHNVVPLANRR